MIAEFWILKRVFARPRNLKRNLKKLNLIFNHTNSELLNPFNKFKIKKKKKP